MQRRRGSLPIVVATYRKDGERGGETMKRWLVISAVLAVLALPLVGWADETTIPPETHWTPYPPARGIVDATKLTDLLVKKGLITPVEQSQLTRPSAVTPRSELRGLDRKGAVDSATSP
jgi:hypothetical protein